MDPEFAVRLLTDTLLAALKMAAPVLLVTLVVGLVVSIIQVATQVQEMTLTFVPKVAAVVIVCLLLGSWMLAIAMELARHLFAVAAGM